MVKSAMFRKTFIVFVCAVSVISPTSSEIIGSSVVTSVSVVLGDGQNPRPSDPMKETIIPEESHQQLLQTLQQDNNNESPYRSFPSDIPFLRKSSRKEEGVQNVIQALKTIVHEEQQKHEQKPQSKPVPAVAPLATTKTPVAQSTTNTNVVQSADESPPTVSGGNKLVPGSSISGEDDDEMESSGNSGGAGSHTTDAIDDFAKHVVSIQPVEQDAENDTATSAEVHDAIHKISGAILSVDDEKAKKPIENIVTDVLTSINTKRNNSESGSHRPQPPTTAAPSGKPPSKKPTTTKPPKTTPRPTQKPTQKPTKKPSTTTAKTTIRPRPPQTPLTTIKPSTLNPSQLKTELDPELEVKEEQFMVKPTSPPPQRGSPPKVELPMIIMLDEKPPMAQEDKNNMNNMNKPVMITQEMSKPMQDSEMMDKPIDNKPMMVDDEQDLMLGGQPETTEFRLPGLPADDPFGDKGSQSQWQNGADALSDSPEDIESDIQVPVEYTTLRPYVTPPTKAPISYWHGKRPVNESTSSTRPNEFYDDEIFGYDPYQTFFHGVYVPVMEVGALTEIENQDSSSEEEDYVTTPKPRRPVITRPSGGGSSIGGNSGRPHTKHGKPTKTNTKKPVPTLPDHLHRPRPSHLQYQHGAADDTDPETGLLNAHYEHPGHSYGPDDSEFITPDKLALHSRPPLPQTVRRNFTEHHDHHIQHQHGIGSHGHGGGHAHDAHDHGHGGHHDHLHQHLNDQAAAEKRPSFAPAPKGNPGLEATLTSLDEEKRLFVDINNRLALRLLSSLTNPVSKSSSSYGNMVISPFTVTSSLGMMFLGARGQTAAQLDGLLQLDDMLTFNPHMMFHNVTESFLSQPNTAAAMIRLLVTDKEKGDVLEFYKTRVQHFYEARVEEVDYKFAGHLAQSIINQMIRAQIQRHSYEMLNYSLPLMGPMSLLTATFFDGQFAGTRDHSVDNINFIHLAALNQGPVQGRRLFQVPALALKGNLRAAYDKDLDATAVELPYTTRDLSLIAVMPGKPGEFAIGGVTSLKSRLNLDAWTKLMRGFYPRDSFKVILPRFRHQTSVNLSHTLTRFGLTDMFEPTLAKFKGINGLADLYLDQSMMHFSEFGTWEKLSDTLTESNSNKNLDLIRILRPHVREHYGNYGEPMSVNEWIFKSRNPGTGEQRSQPDNMPDDISRLRVELERLSRRPSNSNSNSPPAPVQDRYHSSFSSANPFSTYSKVRGSGIQFRPRKLTTSFRTRAKRSKVYYFRQDQTTAPEQETVLRFERPFLYVLRHNPTGMILMTGQYSEPVTEVLE